MDKLYDKAYAGLISFGPRFLLAIVMIIAGIWLIRRLVRIFNNILVKRGIDPSLRPFLTGTISLILQVLLLFAVMQLLGIQLTVFAALVGAVGVAAGLALSGTLQNFTSGILILLLKPFRVGDNVVAQSVEGTVTTIRLFYTVVTTFDNRTVIIPNSKLSNEVIINLSSQGKRRLDIELKFGFGTDFENVKNTIEQIIIKNTSILKDPAFRIGMNKIESDGYIVVINAWIQAHGYHDQKMILQESLVSGLIHGGIKLPGI